MFRKREILNWCLKFLGNNLRHYDKKKEKYLGKKNF